LLGEKSGSDHGKKSNFVVKNAKLRQKKIKQILEVGAFSTIFCPMEINNYG